MNFVGEDLVANWISIILCNPAASTSTSVQAKLDVDEVRDLPCEIADSRASWDEQVPF
jgi:hypothetical protein